MVNDGCCGSPTRPLLRTSAEQCLGPSLNECQSVYALSVAGGLESIVEERSASSLTTISVGSADEWAAAIASEIVPLGVVATPQGFSASVERHDLGNSVRVTRVRSMPNVIQRSSSHISSADDGFAILHVNLQGRIIVQQHDRSCSLSGLGATLYTTDKPSRFAMSTAQDCLLLQLPRQVLPVTTAQFDQALIRPIVPDRVLFRLLLSTLAEAHASPQGEPPEQETLARVAVDLLAGILRSAGQNAVESLSPLLSALRERIERDYTDPDLNVSNLARSLNVSQRVVYRAFAEVGQRPASLIRIKRLERAKMLLRDSDATVRRIGELSGFADFSSFARAFRREMGLSPTEWRSLLRHPHQT